MSGTRETESVPAPSVEAPPSHRPGPSAVHQYERVPDFRRYENVTINDSYQNVTINDVQRNVTINDGDQDPVTTV